MLKRTTPRFWLPTLTLVWGIVATLLGVVQNYAGYLSSRFFLGVSEAGLFPGVVFYLSMWYKRNEQHFRIALFFSAASLAGAFGGVLAWVCLTSQPQERFWIGSHHRALRTCEVSGATTAGDGSSSWYVTSSLVLPEKTMLTPPQEGLFTVVFSAIAYFWVYNWPGTAEFLSKEEREFIHRRLKNDSDAVRNEAFSWESVFKAFKDVKVWLYGLAFHTMALPLYTLSLFMVRLSS